MKKVRLLTLLSMLTLLLPQASYADSFIEQERDAAIDDGWYEINETESEITFINVNVFSEDVLGRPMMWIKGINKQKKKKVRAVEFLGVADCRGQKIGAKRMIEYDVNYNKLSDNEVSDFMVDMQTIRPNSTGYALAKIMCGVQETQ